MPKWKKAKKQNKKKAAKVFVMISMCDLPGLAPRKPIQWTRALHLLILHTGYRFSPGPLSSIFAYHALPLTLPLCYFFFLGSENNPPFSFLCSMYQKRKKENTTVKCYILESLKATWERREAAIMLTYGEKWVANALGFFYLYSSFCSEWPYWAASTWWHSHTVPWCFLPGIRTGLCQYFQVTNKNGKLNPTVRVYCPH